MLRETAKKVLFRIGSTDLLVNAKLKFLMQNKKITILNFHKISSDSRDHRAVSVSDFDSLVSWTKKRYEVISFSQLEEFKTKTTKPLLIYSFDDGYKDYLDYVAPILRKHCITANQNIIPSCVESGLPPMNVLMQDFIQQAPHSLLRETYLPGVGFCKANENLSKLSYLSSKALKNQSIEDQRTVFKLIIDSINQLDSFKPTEMLSLSDILSVLELTEYGIHSFEHATMRYESDDYFVKDLVRCQKWSQDVFGEAAVIYAFPNGSSSKMHVQMALDHGFSYILNVDEDFSEIDSNVFKRFTMRGSGLPELQYRTVNGFSY